MSRLLFEARAAALVCEAKQALIEKEIELEKLKQQRKPWVPLTEFDIDQIPYSCSHADSRLIAYAIEAKLREKNA